METDTLTHKFSIVAQRGRWQKLRPEERKILPEQMRRLLRKARPLGTCWVELENDKGQTDKYFKGANLVPSVALMLGVAAISQAAHMVSDNPALLLSLNIAVFAVLWPKIGTVSKQPDTKSPCYHDRIDMPISKSEYDRLKNELDGRVGKTRFFSTLFNNCSHFAVATAREAGLDVLKARGVVLPSHVSRQIRKLAENDQESHSFRAVTLTERIKTGQLRP